MQRISRPSAAARHSLALALLSAVLITTPAAAQTVLGLGEDATVLPRGAFRASLTNLWTRYEEQYGADGARLPFGWQLSKDPLTAEEIESARPAQTALRAMTGDAAFTLTLGAAQVRLGGRSTITPIAAEYGVTNRWLVGVNMPIVRTLVDVDQRLNPTGVGGNVGLNPAFGNTADSMSNVALAQQLAAASAALHGAITGCQANPGSRPDCAAVLSAGPALATRTDAFGAGVQLVYVNGQLVPLAGSAADAELQVALTGVKTGLQGFGITNVVATAPVGATHSLFAPDFQRILTDPSFHISADSLTGFERIGIGDVELFTKLQWLNTTGTGDGRPARSGFAVRSAVSALVRLPTGTRGDPNSYLDPGTGDGQTDIEVHSQWDLIFGRRFWSSVIVRYTKQFADALPRRITDVAHPYPAAYTLFDVNRQLGSIIDVEVTPRASLGRYFAVEARYLFHHKSADVYSGTFPATNLEGESVTLDAATLGALTALTQHTLAVGVGYSTLSAYRAGRAIAPVELTYEHVFSIVGSGGFTPVVSQDQLHLRFYIGLHADQRRPVKSNRTP